MATLETAFFDLGCLETLAQQQTAIHRLDPRTKLLTTLILLVTVMSFQRHELSALMPFWLYPIITARAAQLPLAYLLKRSALALPFVGLIGILNPLFDQAIVMHIGTLGISGGWLSFLSILLRSLLAVCTTLVLIATTGFHGICLAIERLGAPNVFAVQLLFVYRYLFVLLDEASRLIRARALRSFAGNGFGLKVWSSLIGHLLLRTFDRAQRIHAAMLARGFDGTIRLARPQHIRCADVAFLLGWSSLFVMMRRDNLATLIGSVLTQLIP